MSNVLEADGISLKMGYKYLLKDINWQVKRGEHWIVFGLNGSGKTTLLSIISGFKMPTNGTLAVLGETFSNKNVLQLRKKIGWVSSSFFDKQYTDETALYIVLSGLTGTLGIDGSITDKDVIKAKTLLSQWHVGDKADMPFSMLSKGERQNVLLARALISDPELLILDEPGTGLDVIAREHMLQMVSDMAAEKNVTVIYVTHYPEEIQPLFKKCMFLQNGKIIAQGDINTVLSNEVLSKTLNKNISVHHDNKGFITFRFLEKEET